MWRLVELVVGHDVARDALSSAMGTLATYLGNGRSYAACELFGGSRSVHDVDAYLGRDRTRMLVADVLELGASVESGYMGDVTSAMAHLAGTLAGLGVELDRSRVCRHAVRLLAQYPRRYRSRASAIMSWATCIERQMYVRGRVTEPFPEDPRALEERLEAERVERRDGAQDGRIRERAKSLAGKSYSDDAFRIRPVASASEMVEESESQHNCLATYVEAVAEGVTDIWLMRRTSDPDRSLVTVEVRDGEVRQAFRACNQVPSDSELRWLAAWCERVGYRPHRGRMRALCA
ncbi:MAG: PcfJ domain-containing protein [Atopobiaceae bacterium]|nr:PcfJ domain-containing protein [Atopobiaceae bacterium]